MIKTIQPQSISTADALWALFKSLPKKVQREFTEKVVQIHNASLVTPELAMKISEVENARAKGDTVVFNSAEELDSYLDSDEI